MKASLKRFLEEMGEGYYSLPVAERRATEIMGWVNLVLAAGVIGYMIYDHRQGKKREIDLAERSKLRQAEYERLVAAGKRATDKWIQDFREETKDILDRALNPSEEDLADFRAKLNDPNHVWEL